MIFIILIFILCFISSASGDASRNFNSIISINFNITNSYKLQEYYSNILDILEIDVTKELDSDEINKANLTNTHIIPGFDLNFCPRYFIFNSFLFAPYLGFSLYRKCLQFKIANEGIFSSGYLSEYNQNTLLVFLTPEFGFCFFSKSDESVFSKVTLSPSIGFGRLDMYGDVDYNKLYEFVLVPSVSLGFLFPMKLSAFGFELAIGSKYEKALNENRIITKTFADYYTKSAEYTSEMVSFYISFGIAFAVKSRSEK